MARNVTVSFDDGTSHMYNGAPDDVTPEQITQRAGQEFAGKKVTHLDGGKQATPVKEPSLLEQQISRDTDKNPHTLGETALAVGSGVVGQIAGGLAGASRAVSEAGQNLFREPGKKVDAMAAGAETVGKVQQAVQYHPEGEIAKKGLEGLGKIAEQAFTPSKKVADWAFEHGGSPLVATLTDVAGQAVTTAALDILGLGAVKATSKAAKAVGETSVKAIDAAAEITGMSKKQLQNAAPKNYELAVTREADKLLKGGKITPEEHAGYVTHAKEAGALPYDKLKAYLSDLPPGELDVLHQSIAEALGKGFHEGVKQIASKSIENPISAAVGVTLLPKVMAAAGGTQAVVSVGKALKSRASINTLKSEVPKVEPTITEPPNPGFPGGTPTPLSAKSMDKEQVKTNILNNKVDIQSPGDGQKGALLIGPKKSEFPTTVMTQETKYKNADAADWGYTPQERVTLEVAQTKGPAEYDATLKRIHEEHDVKAIAEIKDLIEKRNFKVAKQEEALRKQKGDSFFKQRAEALTKAKEKAQTDRQVASYIEAQKKKIRGGVPVDEAARLKFMIDAANKAEKDWKQLVASENKLKADKASWEKESKAQNVLVDKMIADFNKQKRQAREAEFNDKSEKIGKGKTPEQLAKDVEIKKAMDEWRAANPGKTMPASIFNQISKLAVKALPESKAAKASRLFNERKKAAARDTNAAVGDWSSLGLPPNPIKQNLSDVQLKNYNAFLNKFGYKTWGDFQKAVKEEKIKRDERIKSKNDAK